MSNPTRDTDSDWLEHLTAPHNGEDYEQYMEELMDEERRQQDMDADYEAGLDAWAAETEQR